MPSGPRTGRATRVRSSSPRLTASSIRAAALEHGCKLLAALHILPVGLLNDIANLEAAVHTRRADAAGTLHLHQSDDHDALGKEFDAYCVPNGHQGLGLKRRRPGGRLQPPQGLSGTSVR